MLKIYDPVDVNDILKFPLEWHEIIRTHVAGAVVGRFLDHQLDDLINQSKVPLYTVSFESVYTNPHLLTMPLNKRKPLIFNDFPTWLYVNGRYNYHPSHTRQNDLPQQMSVYENEFWSHKWDTRTHAPKYEFIDTTYWHWKLDTRKKYSYSCFAPRSRVAFKMQDFINIS